jgi:hypothetical protein
VFGSEPGGYEIDFSLAHIVHTVVRYPKFMYDYGSKWFLNYDALDVTVSLKIVRTLIIQAFDVSRSSHPMQRANTVEPWQSFMLNLIDQRVKIIGTHKFLGGSNL